MDVNNGTEAGLGVNIRRGRPSDSEMCHQIMWHAVTDLGTRHGIPLAGTAADWRPASQRQFQYLSRSAAEWWVAEDVEPGSLIGYARSIQRGGLFELGERFTERVVVIGDENSAAFHDAPVLSPEPLKGRKKR